MNRGAFTAWLLALAALLPTDAAGQCGIDLVQSGITAYRDLELTLATELLTSAVGVAEEASSPCAAEAARALVYLGATHWLSGNAGSARAAFRRAVIQAPRFQPDRVEFPPEVTGVFDDVRRNTPSVALMVPDETEITGGETLGIRLTASTSHTVMVEVRSAVGRPIRTLYRGPVENGPQGLVVTWDGSGSDGNVVESGDYRVEVVSSRLSSVGGSVPVRKVLLEVAVTATPVAPPQAPSEQRPTVESTVPPEDESGTWDAVGTVAVGLVGGGVVVAVPYLIDGGPGSRARFAVGGAISVAGIVGLIQHLRRDPPVAPRIQPPVRTTPAPMTPGERRVVRIQAGRQCRVELEVESLEQLGPVARAEDCFGGGR